MVIITIIVLIWLYWLPCRMYYLTKKELELMKNNHPPIEETEERNWEHPLKKDNVHYYDNNAIEYVLQIYNRNGIYLPIEVMEQLDTMEGQTPGNVFVMIETIRQNVKIESAKKPILLPDEKKKLKKR